MTEEPQSIPQTNQQAQNQIEPVQEDLPTPSVPCPYRFLAGHWLTLSRPQYKRTCGISSLVSLWNFQFSKLGMGNKDPITIEQAMLKLNLIGNGSVEESFRKKFKKTAELTEKNEDKLQKNKQQNEEKSQNSQKTIPEKQEVQDPEISNANKSLDEYINSVDFGCFTGNDTLLKWYRLLCRIYGGSGRSYMFYKTNSTSSCHKTEKSARKALVEGLRSNGKVSYIYHAYDHYFCPVGYEFIPKDRQNHEGQFESSELYQEENQLYIMVGESSKMFPCLHSFKWSEIQLDLTTYWPKKYNIRRRKEGVTMVKGKENAQSKTSTINCIMAFEKLKD